ncbi:MAG: ribonuclease H family protein [Bacteroidaceae bacterium]
MAKKTKYYVVWVGVEPGIYHSWSDCLLQVKSYKGARYKAFSTLSDAEEALARGPFYESTTTDSKESDASHPLTASRSSNSTPLQAVVLEGKIRHIPSSIPLNSIAVDAACAGNPGKMEYRGVSLETGKEIFHFGPVLGTNNIGEFLAIIHALALLKQKELSMPIYTDSRTALSWIRQKKCKTLLTRGPKTEELFKLIERAEKWLVENEVTTPLIKWETKEWGEIPADFGRK